LALFLDTETTGLSPTSGAMIVEIAIADERGQAVVNTLINPGKSIPWQASNVHGITDSMVCDKPTLAQVMPYILEVISNQKIVIYNANFDAPFFPGGLQEAKSIHCAMRLFASSVGSKRWLKLEDAARHVGHTWSGQKHRAFADALACRSVWNWIQREQSTQNANVQQQKRTHK
jgi:DNA polymerase III epsilon subunit-like protein